MGIGYKAELRPKRRRLFQAGILSRREETGGVKAAVSAAGKPAARSSGGKRTPRRGIAPARKEKSPLNRRGTNAQGLSRRPPLLMDLHGTLSVIITARNEADTLLQLLRQVELLNPAEIIVVLNGCTDNSYQQARLCKRATVVHCPKSAGHDVGRALGAKLSSGDILLFLDGDMAIPARQLAVFAAAVDSGIDVALNDLDGFLPPFEASDDVSRCKLYLNAVLGRSDLGVSSMTAVPHALSRRALERIGYRELMVPPKAQALSIMGRLRVEKAGTVNVIKRNRVRKGNTGAGNAMEQLIAGDHAEALKAVLSQPAAGVPPTGERLLEQRSQLAAWRNGL